MIYLEGISAYIHLSKFEPASDEIVSRSGLQIYYNKDAIFQHRLGVLAIPETSDFLLHIASKGFHSLCISVHAFNGPPVHDEYEESIIQSILKFCSPGYGR